jgi:hypothetical protein
MESLRRYLRATVYIRVGIGPQLCGPLLDRLHSASLILDCVNPRHNAQEVGRFRRFDLWEVVMRVELCGDILEGPGGCG